MFSEGINALTIADNQMVQYSHVDRGQRIPYAIGYSLICLTWFRIARRVVVSQYYRAGVIMQRPLQNNSWVHSRTVYGAVEQDLRVDYPVSVVEEHNEEVLPVRVL